MEIMVDGVAFNGQELGEEAVRQRALRPPRRVRGVLVSGGSVPLVVVPQLLALAGACWLLGDFLAGRRSLVVLAGVQHVVHLTLASAHQEPAAVAQVHEVPIDLPMPMPMPMATEPPMYVRERCEVRPGQPGADSRWRRVAGRPARARVRAAAAAGEAAICAD